jgi:hypothetical protein
VAVVVIIRMFVAPLPVFRLFLSLQLGEFPICFALSLLPGLVGTWSARRILYQRESSEKLV